MACSRCRSDRQARALVAPFPHDHVSERRGREPLSVRDRPTDSRADGARQSNAAKIVSMKWYDDSINRELYRTLVAMTTITIGYARCSTTSKTSRQKAALEKLGVRPSASIRHGLTEPTRETWPRPALAAPHSDTLVVQSSTGWRALSDARYRDALIARVSSWARREVYDPPIPWEDFSISRHFAEFEPT